MQCPKCKVISRDSDMQFHEANCGETEERLDRIEEAIIYLAEEIDAITGGDNDEAALKSVLKLLGKIE